MTILASRRLLMGMGSTAALAGLAAADTAAAQTATAAPLRILLLNPNSSPDFTRIIAAEARRVGSPGTEFVEVTAPFGACSSMHVLAAQRGRLGLRQD